MLAQAREHKFLLIKDGSTFCNSIFDGISSTTIPRNMSWLPRLMVSWLTRISVAKPPVSALARFIRSSWKTSKPRKSNGRTDESTLEDIMLAEVFSLLHSS